MAGHSKWANIKHKKAATDKARGKLWSKLIREVTVAAREGGGDINCNPRLRLAVDKARGANMPNDTVERAIKRGTGELEGVSYEEVTYEGYATGGVALIVEALTDNRNRTGSDVRSTFTKQGGSMAEPGAVAWQFERKGMVLVPSAADEDEVMMAALDAGAEDLSDGGEFWNITCDPSDTEAVRAALTDAGFEVESSDLTMVPTSTVPVTAADEAKPVFRLIDSLEDLDDVQNVYTNADFDDEVLAALED